uniref:NDH-dependent cyclic electron flow 5 n=1 Tax=Francoa sonchifolia TaxID=23250 RepID=A0A0F7CYY3_9ROSI
MANTSLFSPHFTPISSKNPSKLQIPFPSNLPFTHNTSQFSTNMRKFHFPIPAVASIPYQPINIDYLEQEFNGHGVTFESVGDICVAKMTMENGSTVSMMLPSGLITSYKAPMWHGGIIELLHTAVSQGENGRNPVIEGGVSVAIDCESEGLSWSPISWSFRSITGNPRESIQIELITSDSGNKVEVKYIITLEEDVLTSEIVVINSKASPIQLKGCLVSHLTVSTPDATYAIGLEGSDFFNIQPFLSKFSMIPPKSSQKKGDGSGWGVLKGVLAGLGAGNGNDGNELESSSQEEMEGEESDNYKQLDEQMSRIYTSAPRNVTVIDRGRRNSVIVGREGFKELYMLSPGSKNEIYSKYSYICIGQSAMLIPIVIGPEDEWKGRQVLHNPNL